MLTVEEMGMCTSEQAFTDRLDWTEETFFSPLCDT